MILVIHFLTINLKSTMRIVKAISVPVYILIVVLWSASPSTGGPPNAFGQ